MKRWRKWAALYAAAAVFSLAAALTAFAAVRLDTVSDVYWDEDDVGMARWEEVEEAYQYEIYLYRDDSKIGTFKTKKEYLNLEKRFTEEGDYTFKVRALAKSSSSSYKTGYWSDLSDAWYVTENYAEFIAAGGVIDTENSGPGASAADTAAAAYSSSALVGSRSEGWIYDEAAGSWWYQNADGSYQSGGWWQDPSTLLWYCFDESGWMRTGWITDGTDTYYCLPAAGEDLPVGAMVTGSVEIDGTVYEFDTAGRLISG